MAFSYPYGAYSVEGTLNEWVQTNLTGAGVPAWMPSARVLFDYPRTPLFSGYSGHAFTLTHLGQAEPLDTYQGRNTIGGSAGQRMGNILEVDCWIDRNFAGPNYMARLRQMGDMVTRLFTSGLSVPLKNLYTGVSAPTAMDALVHLSPAEGTPTVPDPNPDVVRRRYLVRYWWIERA